MRAKASCGWLVLPLVLLSIACGKDEPVTGGPGSGGATGDGGSGRLEPCLDRPNDLPRPPNGRLPCELIPPGLSLPAK